MYYKDKSRDLGHQILSDELVYNTLQRNIFQQHLDKK